MPQVFERTYITKPRRVEEGRKGTKKKSKKDKKPIVKPENLEPAPLYVKEDNKIDPPVEPKKPKKTKAKKEKKSKPKDVGINPPKPPQTAE